MDGKARLGVRNWDFSGQQPPPRGLDSSLKQPSPDGGAPSHQVAAAAAQHAAFLKMTSYPDPSYPSMDFGWVPQRNFLAAAAAAPPKSDLNSTPAPPPPAKPAKKPKKTSRAAAAAATKVQQPKATKKAGSGSSMAPRKEKKGSSAASSGKREKKNADAMAATEGMNFDFSGVPAPVCSCTGTARQCYRWGAAGWQSACCTTTISEYPLPMSSSRPGARLAGRKMSINAYSKLLQRLAVEGYDLSSPVDLKAHWARHGTNKFVTIK